MREIPPAEGLAAGGSLNAVSNCVDHAVVGVREYRVA
jgi:hypothetical protein